MNFYRVSAFFACLLAVASAFAQGSLYQVTPREAPIWGSPIDFKSLRGKVVMVEYWGINCPPCVASIPKLIACQAQFAGTGRFVLIGSHRQGMSNDVTTFLKGKGCNFTIYQGMSFPNDGKEGGGIPYAFLYDHEGNVVASGSPSSVLTKVGPYVELARQAASLLSYDFTPCSGLTLEGQFQTLPKMFMPDKAWSATLKKLEKMGKPAGKKEGNSEAAALYDDMIGVIDKEVEELMEMREKEPVQAMYRLQRLSKNLSGMSQAAAVKEAVIEMKKDKDVLELQKIWMESAKLLDAKSLGIPANKMAGAKKSAGKLVKRLETFCEEPERSSPTVAEAKGLVKKIKRAFSAKAEVTEEAES